MSPQAVLISNSLAISAPEAKTPVPFRRGPKPRPDLLCSVHSRMTGVPFDQNYLNALRDRDADAESFLISHFSLRVKLALRARLRSPDLIQDAWQDTFLRVFAYFRAGKTLDNPASLPGFVHSVCNNTALELLRGYTRHGSLPENAPETRDPGLSPEDMAVTAERKELVAQILDELSEKDRRILRRVFFDEEDKDTVCREFQVSRTNLRLLIHRARKRFAAAASAKRATSGGK